MRFEAGEVGGGGGMPPADASALAARPSIEPPLQQRISAATVEQDFTMTDVARPDQARQPYEAGLPAWEPEPSDAGVWSWSW